MAQAETIPAATPAGGSNHSRLTRSVVATVAERYALVGVLIAAILFFAFDSGTSSSFLTQGNVDNVLRNIAVTGILGMGILVPLVSGYFDLSVPAIAGVANVVVAALLCTYHYPIWLALCLGVAVGPVIGLINGFLFGMLRLNAMIGTLAMYTFLGGVMLAYTKGQEIFNGFPTSLGNWGISNALGIPWPLWIFLIITLLTWYLVARTPFGRQLAAIGSNEAAARLVGIRLERTIFITFLISSLLGAAGGTLLTIQTGNGDATTGVSYLFPAMSVVFLGQTTIHPGRVNVWGAVVALFLTAVVVNGLSLLGASSWVEQVFDGLALIASLAVSSLISRAQIRRAGRLLLNDPSLRSRGDLPGAGNGSPVGEQVGETLNS